MGVVNGQLVEQARLKRWTELSKSRRVDGNWTFLDFDVTDLLDETESAEFRRQTGLSRSPVTLVLPAGFEEGSARENGQNRVVVAFLHGLGGGRGSWGIGSRTPAERRGFVAHVLHSVDMLGKEAIGLVVAGLGSDGARLDAGARGGGLTPGHYSRQLEYAMRSLGLYDCHRIVGIGHSMGAAALLEFAQHNRTKATEVLGTGEPSPELSVVSISPVGVLANSRALRLGCRIAGQGLDLVLSPLLSLWHFSSRRIWDLLGMATVLKGLARQRPFKANLEGIKGLVLVGQHDWIARKGLIAGLQRAGCSWPVAQLAGLGHNLLWHPATLRALVSYMPTLV
jgi:pimeloyl-ACP methyl ester carboxylesterase